MNTQDLKAIAKKKLYSELFKYNITSDYAREYTAKVVAENRGITFEKALNVKIIFSPEVKKIKEHLIGI